MLAVGAEPVGRVRGRRLAAGRWARGCAGRGGLIGAAFTGVLAVVVAAPCTAPFMAPALGFALTQRAGDGAGRLRWRWASASPRRSPLLAFSAGPAAAACRGPGPWMDVLRKLLAFPMYGTAAWLVWVLAQQTDAASLAAVFAAAVARRPRRLDLRRRAAPGAPRGARPRGVFALAAAGRRRRGAADRRRALRRRAVSAGAGAPIAAGAAVRALEPRRVAAAARRGQAGVRQLHRRLVRHLPGQRAGGPGHGRGRRRLPAHRRGLPEGRLDQPRPGHRQGAGRPGPRRRAALSGLRRGRRRAARCCRSC